MTKFSTPSELIKISENSKKNAEKIEMINDMLIEAANNDKREIFIYERELWNEEILSELSQNGFTITEEKQGFIEDPCLHISW